MMRVNWVIAAGHQIDPGLDLDQLKNIGPSWGSWKTWRSCSTDNVICHDLAKSKELVSRAFQAVCNFHVPRSFFQDLGRPMGLKLYDGDYKQQVESIEDIIAMHFAAANSDIVLMLGFDLSKPHTTEDRFEQHRITNYHGLIRSTIANAPETQWVAVDHTQSLDKAYQNLPNLTCDQMENVLKLLGQS